MSRVRPLVVTVIAGAVLAVLIVADRGGLATPPATSWTRLEAWYEAAGPAGATVAGLRCLATLGAAWVLAAAALQLASSWSPRAGLARVATVATPAALRRVLQGAAHLSVTAGLAVPSTTAGPPPDPPGTAVMEVVGPGEAGTATDEPAPPSSIETTTTTTKATTATPATPATSGPSSTVPPPSRAPAAPSSEAGPRADEAVVKAGESFWSIAAEALADTAGEPASDREIHDYWRRLIETNTSRLVDAGNPDLLLPGQRLVLPAP